MKRRWKTTVIAAVVARCGEGEGRTDLRRRRRRSIVPRDDSRFPEVVLVSDAARQKERGAADGARAQHDFSAGPHDDATTTTTTTVLVRRREDRCGTRKEAFHPPSATGSIEQYPLRSHPRQECDSILQLGMLAQQRFYEGGEVIHASSLSVLSPLRQLLLLHLLVGVAAVVARSFRGGRVGRRRRRRHRRRRSR
jgi:hypothetical protein